MKVSEVVSEYSRLRKTDKDVETIKGLVDKVIANIHSYGQAKIDGRHGVLDLSAERVLASFGIDLNNLTHIDSESAWVHKNGKDKFAIGYR